MFANPLKTLTLMTLLQFPLSALADDWALGGYDPVAYMTQDAAIAGQGEISTSWRGKEYHFASDENRALFEANPRAYAPGFDGLCVVALAEGRREPGDPRHFVIIGQRTYLVSSPEQREELLADPRALLMRAKSKWLRH
ncbi:MAG: YHS domain-containing (seleno)protein [Paracoccus sp. (in: a-proteobacteria)]